MRQTKGTEDLGPFGRLAPGLNIDRQRVKCREMCMEPADYDRLESLNGTNAAPLETRRIKIIRL